jgi:ferric-dicitrate binding protein FerR (iron transport regulator)
MKNDERLREMMLRYLDGELAPTELEQLNQAVESDAATRRALAELMLQDTLLSHMGREAEFFELQEPAPRSTSLLNTTRMLKIQHQQESRRRTWTAVAIGAALLFTMTLLLAVKTLQPGDPRPERIAVADPLLPPAAPVSPTPPPTVTQESAPSAPPALVKPATPLVPPPPTHKPKVTEPRKNPLTPATPESGPQAPVVTTVPPGPASTLEPVLKAPLTTFARIELLQGDVVVLSGGNRKIAKVGMDLAWGQGVETSARGGAAVIRYPDGTRVELGARTVIWDSSEKATPRMPEGGLRRLRVMTGTVSAEVSSQPEGRTFVLSSSHAEAKTPGGSLKVATDPDSMRFDLLQGKVRVTRREDQIFVDLEPGQYVTVGRGLALDVRPIPPK